MRKKLLRSRSGFEKPESREEAIMQNILGASNVLYPAKSNIEEILQAILYNTPYTKEAEFEIEKILLAIKNNGTYDGEGESRDMRILIAILNGLDYTEGTESRIEELFVEWLHQRANVNVLEGVPPLTFVAKGNPLINYEISGNTVQDGTPTPDSPIMPQGTGDLETVGAKAGQYKIPISSANTTTPVYLGEVETTRKVRKLVLTGEENWKRTKNEKCYYIDAKNGCPIDYHKQAITTSICSHYQSQNNTSSGSNAVDAGHFCFYIGGGFELYIGETTISSAADFKSYLAAQYAAGTPVTIWYVLATPETAVVNEPLMKIGDYADTLSMEQVGVQIPTNNGTTVIDVDTTLKPSNIYIEYK